MPIVDPWLPYRLYLRHLLLYAVPGAALTIAAFLVGPVAGTIAATLLFVLLLCAAMFRLKERRHLELLRSLDREPCLAHWVYEPGLRERFLARRRRQGWWLVAFLTGAVGLPGLMTGIFLAAKGPLLTDSAAGTILLPTLAGVGLGLAIGLAMWFTRRAVLAKMARVPGEAWIGQTALYLSGQLLLYEGFEMEVEDQTDAGDRYLVFTASSGAGEDSTTREVEVPVPPGDEAAAERILATFG